MLLLITICNTVKAKTKKNKMINKTTTMMKNKILMNRINKIIKGNKKTNNRILKKRKTARRKENISNNKSKKKK